MSDPPCDSGTMWSTSGAGHGEAEGLALGAQRLVEADAFCDALLATVCTGIRRHLPCRLLSSLRLFALPRRVSSCGTLLSQI